MGNCLDSSEKSISSGELLFLWFASYFHVILFFLSCLEFCFLMIRVWLDLMKLGLLYLFFLVHFWCKFSAITIWKKGEGVKVVPFHLIFPSQAFFFFFSNSLFANWETINGNQDLLLF